MNTTDWQPPPGKLALQPGEIHIWRVWLDAPQPAAAMAQSMSEDELQRTGCFAFERDAQRYVRRRTALRRILGGYTGVEPRELCFTYGACGKPRLLQGHPGIEFNLTHAPGLALIAVCRQPVGVDVEMVQPLGEMRAIAGQFFSRRERAALLDLPAEQQTRGFYNVWTRKEALLKALGGGLSLPLEQYEVSLAPMEPARVLSIGGDSLAAAAWVLMALQPAPGYVAALAVETSHARLARWEYGIQ